MGVHARAVVTKDRLGHEGGSLAVPFGHVLDDIFVPLQGVSHLHQRQKAHVDLGLTGSRHLVVMFLDADAHLLHHLDHLGADVLL